jgi:hypothetical protein
MLVRPLTKSGGYTVNGDCLLATRKAVVSKP